MYLIKEKQLTDDVVIQAHQYPLNHWAKYQVVLKNKKKNESKVLWKGGKKEADECYAQFNDFVFIFE